MLFKNDIKFIARLKLKKNRQHEGLFVVEGTKTITELLHSYFKLYKLYTTQTFNINAKEEVLISENELKRISFLSTPNRALAIFKIPKMSLVKTSQLTLALDAVRDPGNLGTIIRLCDWFGIAHLVCSKETVDCYNPKVIQATMGSIARVHVSYLDLDEFLTKTKLPIYGAFMNGENIYTKKLPEAGILVMGNEANGISKTIEAIIDEKIAIPQFGTAQKTESLNVATATAILLSEFKRN